MKIVYFDMLSVVLKIEGSQVCGITAHDNQFWDILEHKFRFDSDSSWDVSNNILAFYLRLKFLKIWPQIFYRHSVDICCFVLGWLVLVLSIYCHLYIDSCYHQICVLV